MTVLTLAKAAKTLLVQPVLPSTNSKVVEHLAEFVELAKAASAVIVETLQVNRQTPDAKYFIGSGKVEELAQLVKQRQVKQVLFNCRLSPSQKRNLGKLLQCAVIDRTELILHIFALRARTFEGKLQVELAQLQYAATQLVRGWTHLERQKGGIGLRGGPGETQLEVDKRLIRNRIKNVRARLDKVQQQRELGRRARQRSQTPTVSLVGYTNAGKSTLFNRLARADVYVADQLFATLDPTLRRIHLPARGTLILADTVGFIRDLPHDLVNAFHATLEETLQADLLLHVIDTHSASREQYQADVQHVLQQIGADQVPQLLVFNKLDLLPEQKPRIGRDDQGKPIHVWLSASTGAGIDLLQQALLELLPAPTTAADGEESDDEDSA